MLSLYVDGDRWHDHLHRMTAAQPGLVPVIKGNGYGFGRERLCRVSDDLGADIVAVGTYAEVEQALRGSRAAVMVLSPWRPFEARVSYHPRLVHTLGRIEDLRSLSGGDARAEHPPRVVLELLTSMLRHGFTARGLREAAAEVGDVEVEGFALHLPMTQGSHLAEVERHMEDIVASGLAVAPSRRVFVSHMTDAELARLAASWPEFEFRPRVGTRLWLGERGALRPRASILDVHEVERGDVFGYRGRSAPKHGHIVIVSGGTSHGVGLEAPSAGASVRDRAARLARGGLDAAGFVRSPFTIAGKQRLFAEPPHMQASMLFVPAGTPIPAPGSEIPVQVRYTITDFDRIVVS